MQTFIVLTSLLHCSSYELEASSGDKCEDSTCLSGGNVSLLQVDRPLSRTALRDSLVAASHSTVSLVGQPADDVTIRPNLKNGTREIVEFGIMVKNWFGIDFAGGTFTVDIVITARWQDDRAKKLIPSGASSVRLAIKDAQSSLWLPDIQVTNHIQKGIEVISSSVLVEKSGALSKVQRELVTLKAGYITTDFPFDTQLLNINIASTVYMRDEVVLKATKDPALWSSNTTELFSNSPWNVLNMSLMSVIDDTNGGLLKKSRGVLAITVKRSASQYFSSIFVPSFVLLMMTWSSLWLPVAAPYVMPRVAVSVISVLCMMSLASNANNMIPATGKMTWMGQYLEILIELQFCNMVFNALILSLEHKGQDRSELANAIDEELIFAYPTFAGMVIGCVYLGYFAIGRGMIGLALFMYLASIYYRFRR